MGARKYGYDMLRVTCAVIVCIFHFEGEMVLQLGVASWSLGAGAALDVFGCGLGAGRMAVGLFFIMSGALSVEILHDEGFSGSLSYPQRVRYAARLARSITGILPLSLSLWLCWWRFWLEILSGV